MRETLDPLAASDDIVAAYRSYLRTSFRPADAAVRRELDTALAESIDLTRGPMLQASAPYEAGASLSELVGQGILTPRLLDLPGDEFPADRPLYAHQEQAIRKAVAGRNLVVATGTGSGKTECYLLPVIDTLLREAGAGTLGRPGVRALLLYPMNALANDQMKRLRGLLRDFPDDHVRALRRARPGTRARGAIEDFRQRYRVEPRLPNELHLARGDAGHPAAHPPHELRDARVSPAASRGQHALRRSHRRPLALRRPR